MNNKRRRPFTLRNAYGIIIAEGIVYDQGNVQVLWRKDLGWGGEQYQTMANVLDLIPGVKSFNWEYKHSWEKK